MVRLALAFLLTAGSAIAASTPVQPEQIPIDVTLKQARAEAAQAAAEQRRLEAAADSARDEASRLHARQLAAVQAIAAAEASISAADAQAQLTQALLSAQRQKLAAEQAPVSSLLGGLAIMARRPPVLLLANGGTAEDLVKLRILLSATAPVIQSKTAALARQLDQGQRLERDAVAARDGMRRSRDELARRRDVLAELEVQAAKLAETRGSQALGAGDVAIARGEQVGELQEQARSGRSAMQIARELAQLGPAPLQPLGSPERVLAYRLPADAPVTDGLGSVSANGVRSRAITLATRRGSPLVVPAAGTILFVGPFRDYDGVVIIDHGDGWKSVLVNAGSRLPRGARVELGQPLGIALGPVEVQLQHGGQPVSPALIAGSSQILSNARKAR